MASKHGRNSIVAIVLRAQSTYTEIAQLDSISGGGVVKSMVNVDGYKSTAIGKVADPAIELNSIGLRVTFDPSVQGHDETDGLQYYAATNIVFSLEVRGPDYASPDTDMWRASGQVTGWTDLAPKDDARRAEFEFTPDGSDLRINGVTFVTQTV